MTNLNATKHPLLKNGWKKLFAIALIVVAFFAFQGLVNHFQTIEHINLYEQEIENSFHTAGLEECFNEAEKSDDPTDGKEFCEGLTAKAQAFVDSYADKISGHKPKVFLTPTGLAGACQSSTAVACAMLKGSSIYLTTPSSLKQHLEGKGDLGLRRVLAHEYIHTITTPEDREFLLKNHKDDIVGMGTDKPVEIIADCGITYFISGRVDNSSAYLPDGCINSVWLDLSRDIIQRASGRTSVETTPTPPRAEGTYEEFLSDHRASFICLLDTYGGSYSATLFIGYTATERIEAMRLQANNFDYCYRGDMTSFTKFQETEVGLTRSVVEVIQGRADLNKLDASESSVEYVKERYRFFEESDYLNLSEISLYEVYEIREVHRNQIEKYLV